MGKKPALKDLPSFLKKHPHGRGEEMILAEKLYAGRETPPRAWGRKSLHAEVRISSRNTPTGVGKKFSLGGFNAAGRKHPHGRGEEDTALYTECELIETPPRAWGRMVIL